MFCHKQVQSHMNQTGLTWFCGPTARKPLIYCLALCKLLIICSGSVEVGKLYFLGYVCTWSIGTLGSFSGFHHFPILFFNKHERNDNPWNNFIDTTMLSSIYQEYYEKGYSRKFFHSSSYKPVIIILYLKIEASRWNENYSNNF